MTDQHSAEWPAWFRRQSNKVRILVFGAFALVLVLSHAIVLGTWWLLGAFS